MSHVSRARADSSPAKDTRTKRLLYARFLIADYFVVDIKRDELIHFSKPQEGDYTSTRRLARGESFALAAVPRVELESDPFLREP